MFKNLKPAILTICVLLLGYAGGRTAHANTLAEINGARFDRSDFINWWEQWREGDAPFPDTVEPYIEWLLLSQEAERMELYAEPAFQQKVNVFLKARTMVILKNEEVDSKIVADDEVLKRFYDDMYIPRWETDLLYFADKDIAEKIAAELRQGHFEIDELDKEQQKEKGILYSEEKWLRPIITPEVWEKELRRMKTGEVSDPISKGGNTYAVIALHRIKGHEKEDFEAIRMHLERSYREYKERQLTDELLKKLHHKFDVHINKELLYSFDPEKAIDVDLEKSVIRTNRKDIPLGVIGLELKKNLQFLKSSLSEAELNSYKDNILESYLSHTLLLWEARDRGYETKEPFARIYQFYRQHRLIKELEKSLFTEDIQVGEEEISRYYENNINHYIQPAKITVAILEDSKNVGKKIWYEVVTGGDFFKAAKKYYPDDIPVSTLSVSHLKPEIQEITNKLADGDVSQPFKVGETQLLVKLISREASSTVPLEKMRKTIFQKLQQDKLTQARSRFVALLKNKSEINVNDQVWQEIKEEFGDQK